MSQRLNMSVGQTDLHPVYRDALLPAIETPAYFAEYKQLYARLVSKLQTMLGTKEEPLVVLGTGRTGLEVGVYALVRPGDRVLCLENGHWGHFFGDLCENIGARVDRLGSGEGKPIDWEGLASAVAENDYDLVTMAHCETSTGALHDPGRVREVVGRTSRTMLLVDGISAFGGVRVDLDAWNVDLYVGGSQKCLNAAQGTPVVCFSARAREHARRVAAERPHLHTLDLAHKPSYLLVRALDALLSSLLEEGLEQVYARHDAAARAICAGLPALGLAPFVDDAALRAPSVTRIAFPEALQRRIHEERKQRGIDQDVVTQSLMSRCGVVIGEDRIGTMGCQASEACVMRMLEALGTVMADLGYAVEVARALELARNAFRGLPR